MVGIRIFFISILLLGCGTSIPEALDNTLSPPQIYNAYYEKHNDNGSLKNSIVIEYYAYNIEQRFDGYNVYITDQGSVETQNIPPLKPNGSEPTIPMRPEDADTSILRTYRVLTQSDNISPLLNTITYRLMMKAHSSTGGLSAGSNEVAVTILE